MFPKKKKIIRLKKTIYKHMLLSRDPFKHKNTERLKVKG